MANFYTDIPELKYHLNNPMMERICQLKERDYRDKDEFDYAPQDYADAMDSYDKILEITGEITGETIAPNAESGMAAHWFIDFNLVFAKNRGKNVSICIIHRSSLSY